MNNTTAFVTLNLHFAQCYDLNLSETLLCAYYFAATAWAKSEKIDGKDYYFISRNKVVSDLPTLTDKPDTIYRLSKTLCEKGIISMLKIGKDDFIAPNKEKVLEWQKMKLGKISDLRNDDLLGKISEQSAVSSEKFPNEARKNFRHIDSYSKQIVNITDSYAENSKNAIFCNQETHEQNSEKPTTHDSEKPKTEMQKDNACPFVVAVKSQCQRKFLKAFNTNSLLYRKNQLPLTETFTLMNHEERVVSGATSQPKPQSIGFTFPKDTETYEISNKNAPVIVLPTEKQNAKIALKSGKKTNVVKSSGDRAAKHTFEQSEYADFEHFRQSFETYGKTVKWNYSAFDTEKVYETLMYAEGQKQYKYSNWILAAQKWCILSIERNDTTLLRQSEIKTWLIHVFSEYFKSPITAKESYFAHCFIEKVKEESEIYQKEYNRGAFELELEKALKTAISNFLFHSKFGLVAHIQNEKEVRAENKKFSHFKTFEAIYNNFQTIKTKLYEEAKKRKDDESKNRK